VATATGIDILLHRSDQVNGREIGDQEGILLHHLDHIGLLQNGTLDRRPVTALITDVVLDVEHGFGVGVGDDGLQSCGGGALKSVLHSFGNGRSVFWIGAGSGYLPGLLDVAPKGLEE
ncbi:hypothetical protein LINPERPRIM_LOCUS23243, partial [Linum perenne]